MGAAQTGTHRTAPILKAVHVLAVAPYSAGSALSGQRRILTVDLSRLPVPTGKVKSDTQRERRWLFGSRCGLSIRCRCSDRSNFGEPLDWREPLLLFAAGQVEHFVSHAREAAR